MKRHQATAVQSKPVKQIKTEVLSDDENAVSENCDLSKRDTSSNVVVKVEKTDDTLGRVVSIIYRGILE